MIMDDVMGGKTPAKFFATPTKDISREEWLSLRKRGIGGSDAAAILGLSPFSSPYAVWADKVLDLPEREESEALRIGRDLEEYVARRFSERTGLSVRRENFLLQSVQNPFMLANIDRRVVGRPAGLECKTTNAYNKKNFVSADGEVSFPAHYYVQCVHYLAVTGLEDWYLACLVMGTEFRIYRLTTNPSVTEDSATDGVVFVSKDEIDSLIERERDFWTLVENRTPPLPDGSDATCDIIRRTYPISDDNAETKNLSDMESRFDEYFDLREQAKEIDRRITEIENEIKVRMDTACTAECGAFRASWKSSARSQIDVKALKEKYPDIAKEMTKATTTRPFRILGKKG